MEDQGVISEGDWFTVAAAYDRRINRTKEEALLPGHLFEMAASCVVSCLRRTKTTSLGDWAR